MTELEQMFDGRISKPAMIEALDTNRDNYLEAIEITLTIKYPRAWRAAWILNHVTTEKHFPILKPHITRFIDGIKKYTLDGHQRELLRLVSRLPLDEDQEGRLFVCCMTIWESVGKSPSVRHFAFLYILDVIKRYPELKSEIQFSIQPEYLETLSPGIRNGIQKRIRKAGLAG